jgi:hypothetical protein
MNKKTSKSILEEIFALKIRDRIIFGIYKKEVIVKKTRIVINKGIDEI